jgi:hypothetical protein
MKKNMGGTDRLLRSLAAIAFIILYATGTVSGAWGITLLVMAGILLLTSLLSFCPLYFSFGYSSCCQNCRTCEAKEVTEK